VVTAADAVDRTVAVPAVASGVLTPRVATTKFEFPAVLLGVNVAVATPLEFVTEVTAVTVPVPVPPTVQTTGTPTSAAELLSRRVAVTVYGEPPAVNVVEVGDRATVRVPLLSTS
jgi:hypothetical protein